MCPCKVLVPCVYVYVYIHTEAGCTSITGNVSI